MTRLTIRRGAAHDEMVFSKQHESVTVDVSALDKKAKSRIYSEVVADRRNNRKEWPSTIAAIRSLA